MRDAHGEGRGRLLKTSQLRVVERVERGEAAAREEPDRLAGATADRLAQPFPRGEQAPRPIRLELEQRSSAARSRSSSTVTPKRRRSSAGQIHASQAPGRAARPGGSSRAGGRCTRRPTTRRAARRRRRPITPSTSRPTGSAEWRAVPAQVVPALVLRDPLVHAVRLDQPRERLARQSRRPRSSAAAHASPATRARPLRSRRRAAPRARRAQPADPPPTRRRGCRRAGRSRRSPAGAAGARAERAATRPGSSPYARGQPPPQRPSPWNDASRACDGARLAGLAAARGRRCPIRSRPWARSSSP